MAPEMGFTYFRILFFIIPTAIGFSLLAMKLAYFGKLMDYPGKEIHKLHSKPIPLAGGLVLVPLIFIFSLVEGFVSEINFFPILLPGLIVFVLGVIDDRFILSPLKKIIGQTLAAIILIALGVKVQIFSNPVLDYGLTIIWVVAVTNAFNFVDSMDGLSDGLAGITAGFFMLAANDAGQTGLSLFCAILLGACVGVFFFTSFPAHYFLGDSGAQFLGFVLSAVAIGYNPLGFLPVQSWFIPILLIGVPLFDTALVIISRVRRNKPIYRSNLDHTYHRFVIMGMHPNRAVLTMHFMAILLGAVAFVMLNLQPFWANTLFLMILVSGTLLIAYLEKWIPKI
jgi:UDP-GlcNAc:undecaprenyl-phosphate GlcNAc-1-phosphate transferase